MSRSQLQPYQIRLVVSRSDDGYTARWIEVSGQQSEDFPLALPLTGEDIDELRWYLETYHQFPGAGDHVRAEKVKGRINEWGRQLFDALFNADEGNECSNIYHNLMNAADRGQSCLLTIGERDPNILAQPWEMMRDDLEPLAFQGVTIRRQLRGIKRQRHYELSPPLRVLLIVSRPSDIGFIDPRNSIAPVFDVLDALPVGLVRVDFCDPPTIIRLEEMISQAGKRGRPYHIVHFDGHGTYLPRTGVGALAFEFDDGTTDLVTGTKLGILLERLNVPLVLLEACRSSDLSDRPVFYSVAPALLEKGVASVVAFSHSVHIKAARLLVERFYKELTEGMTIGQALQEARSRLYADPARYLHLGPNAETVDLQDWFIPQLYQVGDDPVLIGRKVTEPDAAPERKATPREEALHGFPPPPMYRFHGRAHELLDIERAFRVHPAAVLNGMGGMGKTALAREAAHWWLRTGRFDAAVFCSFEQKAGAERVVQIIGQALEGDEFSSRSAEEQWKAAVQLFHSRRVLLVWDNFESTLPIYQRDMGATHDNDVGATHASAESAFSFGPDARAQLVKLYRDLTANSPEGRLLVTCRPAETGLPGIKEMSLKGLARPDSLHLLAAILDIKGISTDRKGYEREEIDKLLNALDDHPLSIELVAPHLKTLTPEQIRTEFSGLLGTFADSSAFESRNRSLLASLEFSKKRLSEDAQEILPYLAWFEGGVFEEFLLDFTELDPEVWDSIRTELLATALVSVEELEQFETPYLRFHPTLPYAASPNDVPDPEAAEERFIAVYLSVMRAADGALHGSQPAAGMELMAREEANLRAAINRAFGRGQRRGAGMMAGTLSDYLERAGRLRERDALAEWVHAQLPEGEVLDEAACAAIRDHAWSRFTQGHADEAIGMVKDLITRLETEGLTGGEDSTYQISLSYTYLGRIYYRAGRSDLALEPLQKAIAGFEKQGDAGRRSDLSVALGSLANARRHLGQFDAALEAAERGLDIHREFGHDRNIAAGLGRIAQILMEQQRYAEADARHSEALRAARAAGDLGLQGALLQHQGMLQNSTGNHDRAVEFYRQAINIFQRAADLGEEMRTCDLLATAERQRGHLDAAEAWYARARELALQLNDRAQLAAIAQNVGILHQNRAEGESDPDARAVLLRQAAASVEESLAGWLKLGDQVHAAASYFQLSVPHRMLGELDRAEEYARESLKICELLNLPDVYKDYGNLAEIARARGDAEAAAGWQAKRDAKVAELARLRIGEGAAAQAASLSRQLSQIILPLAQAAYAARASKSPLPPDAAEALAQIAELPPPFGAIGKFLQAIAAGEPVPPAPAGLPQEVEKVLKALIEQINEE